MGLSALPQVEVQTTVQLCNRGSSLDLISLLEFLQLGKFPIENIDVAASEMNTAPTVP